jgi:hypothetical protein
MAKLDWSAIGERFYETGIDRGVLYVGEDGFVWPGLISITESPSGGDAKPFYLDGIKYLNIAAAEEFEATINAFFAPAEFNACDGTVSIHNGLFATQQPRKPFGLSYRTRVGNDIDGAEYAYKVHLVYNALAAPSERENSTLNDSIDPAQYSWAITTTPPMGSGVKPTAHFVIDSRFADPTLLASVEDILYGNEVGSSRLPSVTELIDLFNG